MNYKEKYEQALKRARVINEKIKGGKGFTTPPNYTICETIFPELAESEDEKIRKEIISHLKSDGLTTNHKWISWLEKQGEHANFRNKIQIGDKVTRYEDGVLVNLSQLERVAKPSEKQIEQKPDWSEENEKKIMWLVRLISTAGFRELDNDKMPCSRSELIDWLKSLKTQPRWKPSEDQMEALNQFNIIGAVTSYNKSVLKNLYNDLKKL